MAYTVKTLSDLILECSHHCLAYAREHYGFSGAVHVYEDDTRQAVTIVLRPAWNDLVQVEFHRTFTKREIANASVSMAALADLVLNALRNLLAQYQDVAGQRHIPIVAPHSLNKPEKPPENKRSIDMRPIDELP